MRTDSHATRTCLGYYRPNQLTCRCIYVIADVVNDARGVNDVMPVTSSAFQPPRQSLTQSVERPLAMKTRAGRRRRRRGRGSRPGVEARRYGGHGVGGGRGDRVHLA